MKSIMPSGRRKMSTENGSFQASNTIGKDFLATCTVNSCERQPDNIEKAER